MLDGKKVSYSGVQPSGNLTIGNYLGAIKNFSAYSEQYKCFYCVVDEHAITVRQVPADLRRRMGLQHCRFFKARSFCGKAR